MHAHTRPPAASPAQRRTPRSLWNNKIGDAGAAALAKALPTSQLAYLRYVHAPPPPPCRCHRPAAARMAVTVAAGTTPVPCGCARCLRRAAAPCAHHSRPPRPPSPLLCSHYGNNIGGKCGTGSDSPSGAKGALCDAWRAKHGDKAKFDYGGMTVAGYLYA